MDEKKKKQEKPKEAEQSEETVSCEETQKAPDEDKALLEEKERYLRLYAEYDNFKKRTAKEKEELYAAAAADVLKKLFPVFDNLERACVCTDYETLKKGVDMILDNFHTALSACGVQEIEAQGKEFDPALHEAVFHEERDDVGENTVCEVLQKGYLLGDRVLRHAMVKVAN